MISIIAAVAEMERDTIRVQTMAGREQKAKEGGWNGGFAPYGYRLEDNATGHKCTFRLNIEQSQINDVLARIISSMTKEGKLTLI